MKKETTIEYADRMRPLLEKYRKAKDRLTNEELKSLFKHFEMLEKLLYAGGERFYFAWIDANNQLQRVSGFMYHRQQGK